MTRKAVVSNSRQNFGRNLNRWYDNHARDLPWRRTRDAYRIWISEIMLQQTTVVAVVPYFERFLARFPTVQQLADAEEDEVLRHWEGLGYYSRARNIHRTARLIVAENGGAFPADVELLQKLPGIGRYTAGAIASFAFDLRAPIVEANTLRLYSRLMGYGGDPRSTEGQRVLWTFAGQILPRKHPGRFNQALMELGATVCTPVEPDCSRCPLRRCCAAFAEGRQDEIPRRAARPEITAVTEACVAIGDEGRYLLVRRPEGERWAGLWDFPRFATDVAPDFATGDAGELRNGGPGGAYRRVKRLLEQNVREAMQLEIETGELLTRMVHGVTRYRITLLCFLADFRGGTGRLDAEAARWVDPAEFGEYPLCVTGRKMAKLLADRAGAAVERE